MTFHLETERLIIRNWRDSDRELFHEINSDPRVMEYFPFTRDRLQSDELLQRLRTSIDAEGFGFTAMELRETGECLGFCGLARTNIKGLPSGLVEIGWRLAVRHWGQGYVSEAAGSLLEFGFTTLDLEEIVSFAVHDNHRSTNVMKRLGMVRIEDRDFDHPLVPDTHPHLKRHVFYAMSKARWQKHRK